MTIPSSARQGLVLALLVMILDQATKWWIVDEVMRAPRVIPVAPFFNLVMAWNRGVSFGLFDTDSPYNAWLLSIVALAIVAVLVTWLWRAEGRLLPAALGLVVGGALGNVIDRVRFGAVADFLDFHVGECDWCHWPAFNAADTAITIGAAALFLDALFGGAERHKKKGSKKSGDGK